MVDGYGSTTPTLDIEMAPALVNVKVLVTVFFLGFASVSGVAIASGSARDATRINASTRLSICRLLFDVLVFLASRYGCTRLGSWIVIYPALYRMSWAQGRLITCDRCPSCRGLST